MLRLKLNHVSKRGHWSYCSLALSHRYIINLEVPELSEYSPTGYLRRRRMALLSRDYSRNYIDGYNRWNRDLSKMFVSYREYNSEKYFGIVQDEFELIKSSHHWANFIIILVHFNTGIFDYRWRGFQNLCSNCCQMPLSFHSRPVISDRMQD